MTSIVVSEPQFRRGMDISVGPHVVRVVDVDDANTTITTRHKYEWLWIEWLLQAWERRVLWPLTDLWRRFRP